MSFRTMKEIHEVLKVNYYLEIRYQKNLSDPKFPYIVQAWFDESNPYLSRASPITLAYLPTDDADTAVSLGVKKAILFLLGMAKEDAGFESTDLTYATELPHLRDLEIEIENRLHRV